MEAFRQRLRQLRERKGVSQRTLGELCGLSVNTVRCYEAGQRSPTARNLIALADFFNVSTDYLLGRSDMQH